MERVSYLWIDDFEARLVFIHLEVELGGGDGQDALHHHGRSHQLSTGAQVYWAWRRHRSRLKNNHGVGKSAFTKPPTVKVNL